MKIRLTGSPDLVRAWSAALEKAFGVRCAEYPCRGSNEIRAYVDIDDRIAAAVAFQSAEQAQKGYERTVRALRQAALSPNRREPLDCKGIDPKSSTGKTTRRK